MIKLEKMVTNTTFYKLGEKPNNKETIGLDWRKNYKAGWGYWQSLKGWLDTDFI